MGLLHEAGLASFYTSDIWALNPLLEQMSARGMPVDQQRRLEAAKELQQERDAVLAKIRALVPRTACKEKVYKKRPRKLCPEHLRCESILTTQSWCLSCERTIRRQPHKCKKSAEPQIEKRLMDTSVWVYTIPFIPSGGANGGMVRYLKAMKYTIPTRRDRATGDNKQTTDEASLLRLALRHEKDEVLPLVLRLRDLEKQLSTYLGWPE